MSDIRTFDGQDDRTLLALAAGLVAALLGGAAWAAIVVFMNYEIGWVAWGIGLAVGAAMGAATPARSRKLAVAAAVMALVGLLAGKAFVVAGSAGSVADEIVESPDYLAGAMAWQLYSDGELAEETAAEVRATEEAGDTLSDAVWADMLAQGGERVDAMSEEERRAMAEALASGFIQDMGLVEGVRAQLSGFDLLWLFLAVGTAFRMMDALAVEPEPALADAVDPQDADPVA